MKPDVGKGRSVIDSLDGLHAEVRALRACLSLPETEHTWEKIEAGLRRFTATVRGGACQFEEDVVRTFREPELAKRLIACISTERTRLSGTALDLIAATTGLGHAFTPLLSVYGPHIIRLFARTNKLYISRAQACFVAIIQNTRQAAIIHYLREAVDDKSSTVRRAAVELTLTALEGEPMAIDRTEVDRKYLGDIEHIIRKGASDREVKTREVARVVWTIYRARWPERIAAFAAPLTPLARKYLNLPLVDAVGPVRPAARPRSPHRGLKAAKANPGLGLTQSVGAPTPTVVQANAPGAGLSHSIASSKPSQRVHQHEMASKSAPLQADDLFAPLASTTLRNTTKGLPVSGKAPVKTSPIPDAWQPPASPIEEIANAQPAVAITELPSLPSILIPGARVPSRTAFKPAPAGREKPVPTAKPGRAVTAPVAMSKAVKSSTARPALAHSISTASLTNHDVDAEGVSRTKAVQPVMRPPPKPMASSSSASSRPGSRTEISRPQSRTQGVRPDSRALPGLVSVSQVQAFKPVKPASIDHSVETATDTNNAVTAAAVSAEPSLSRSTSARSVVEPASGHARSASFNKATAASIAKANDAARLRKERDSVKETIVTSKRQLPPHLAGALLMRKQPAKLKAETRAIEEIHDAQPDLVTKDITPEELSPMQPPIELPADCILPMPMQGQLEDIDESSALIDFLPIDLDTHAPFNADANSQSLVSHEADERFDVDVEDIGDVGSHNDVHINDMSDSRSPVVPDEPLAEPATDSTSLSPVALPLCVNLDVAVAAADCSLDPAPVDTSTCSAPADTSTHSAAAGNSVHSAACDASIHSAAAEESLPSAFIKPHLAAHVELSTCSSAAPDEHLAPSQVQCARLAEGDDSVADIVVEPRLEERAESPPVATGAIATRPPRLSHYMPLISKTVIRSPPFASLPTPPALAPATFSAFAATAVDRALFKKVPSDLQNSDKARSALRPSDLDAIVDAPVTASQKLPARTIETPSPFRSVSERVHKFEMRSGKGGKREPLSPLLDINRMTH